MFRSHLIAMAAGGDAANGSHGDDGSGNGRMLHIPFVNAFKETPKMKEVSGLFFHEPVNPSFLLWFCVISGG